MKYVKCPKCGKEVKLDVAKTIDEEGEVFKCDHCNWPFRYVQKWFPQMKEAIVIVAVILVLILIFFDGNDSSGSSSGNVALS
jgi:DNA-directed RNA polymerase subunit RPC12/RpoP